MHLCASSSHHKNKKKNRCLKVNKPVLDTTSCVDCSSCKKDQYMIKPCNGTTYYDMRECGNCKYNSSTCPAGPFFFLCLVLPCIFFFKTEKSLGGAGTYVINECLNGLDQQDRTNCTNCNNNCEAANFSIGKAGQFIRYPCTGIDGNKDNVCQNCLTTCGQDNYVSAPCTGLNQQDTQCSPCKKKCADDEFIQGTCTGTTLKDVTSCVKCTPKPGPKYYTLNQCNGATRQDQVLFCFVFFLLFFSCILILSTQHI